MLSKFYCNTLGWKTVPFIFICTNDILGISALILGAIFGENNIFSVSETAYFSALFHKKLY